MAPSVKVLEAELVKTVREVFNSDERPNLTVNLIRKRVQDKFDLDDGFFASKKWKERSKELIKGLATELLDNESNADPQSSQVKEEVDKKPTSPVKRRLTESSSPEAKRRKSTKKEEGDDSDDMDSNRRKKKALARRQSRPVVDSEDEDSPVKVKPSPDRKPPLNGRARKAEELGPSTEKVESDDDEKPKIKKAEVESGDDEKPSSPVRNRALKKREADSSEDEKPRKRKLAIKKREDEAEEEAKPAVKDEEPKPTIEDESSELSDVIDIPPKPKRKKKEPIKAEPELKEESSELSDVIDEPPHPKRKKKDASSKASSSKAQKKTPNTVDSPDEAEIKKLQSHLVKCGIRKIWGFELKKFGDDSKAKIRHLKAMLRDVGMDGRFSEARAREIKEQRELAADLEAVKEMNENWGAGGRSSRSKVRDTAKVLKEDSPEDEDDEDDEDGAGFARPRVRKAQADLAFLGDDSESD